MHVGRERTRVVHAHVEQAGVARPPEERDAERPVEVLGKDREHVDAHARHRSNRPSGRSTTTTPGFVLDDEHHRHERAAVEHEQVVRGIRLHRLDAPERAPARSRTSEPISSCTQSSPSGASPSALGLHRLAAQRLGRVAVVDAREAARPSRCRPRRADSITSARSPTNRREPGANRSATIA